MGLRTSPTRGSGADGGSRRDRFATCGYDCHDYSDVLALRKEERINGCQHLKQISRIVRPLHFELGSTPALGTAIGLQDASYCYVVRPVWLLGLDPILRRMMRSAGRSARTAFRS